VFGIKSPCPKIGNKRGSSGKTKVSDTMRSPLA
jgi:hypothetical protein